MRTSPGTGFNPGQAAELDKAVSTITSRLLNRAYDPNGGHLGPELNNVVKALIESISADYLTLRSQLLKGLPPGYVGMLAVNDVPRIQLMLDLSSMNRVEVLRDGTVPLGKFVENLRALNGSAGYSLEQVQAAVVRLNGMARNAEFTGAAARFNNYPPAFTAEKDVANGRPGVNILTGGLSTNADWDAFHAVMDEAVTQAGFKGMPVTFFTHE